MIFVTVGSQKFQFNRLLIKLDELVKYGIIEQKIFAQIGNSDYIPQQYSFKHFLDKKEFVDIIKECDIVITHGGTGTIINAIKQGKKVIAIPRLVQYGEHVDNHQIQLIEQFTKRNFIYGLQDCDELEKALYSIKNAEFNTYTSNTYKYIEHIEKFLKEEFLCS